MIYSISDIRQRLIAPLPGEIAHLELSPANRPIASEELKRSLKYVESAVALILYEKNSELNVILTQRQSYKGFHSKQISFPGGKKENFDPNLLQTAKRETYEEIGLNSNNFELLGELTPVYIPISGFKVQPYVFYYKETPLFSKQDREVAEIITFPLPMLFQQEILKRTDLTIFDGKILKDVPYFDIQNKVVWGATALILNEFKTCLL